MFKNIMGAFLFSVVTANTCHDLVEPELMYASTALTFPNAPVTLGVFHNRNPSNLDSDLNSLD